LPEASTRLAIVALIGNAALAAAKYVVAAVSGSGAVFAEAVHSTVDACNEALLLLGIQRTERPRDGRRHPGHGREIYFWSVVAAILVFGVGAGVSISRGVERLAAPVALGQVGWIYLVLVVALAFQAGSWIMAWRRVGDAGAGRPLLMRLRQADDPALFPLVFADTAGIAALLVALAGVVCSDRLGWLWADGAAALGIGGILGLAALVLVIETRGLLIGETSEPRLMEDIMGVAGRAAFVHGVNEVRTMQFAPADILVNLSVDARDHLSAGEVERGIAALEAELRARHPAITRVFVEIQAAPEAAEGPAPA
jgi:cation diffusion facilitator family transporter